MLLNSSKEINTGGWFDNLRQRYSRTSFGFSEIQTAIFQQPFVRSSYIQPGELAQISISNDGELNYLMRRYNSGQETYLPLKASREFTEKIFLAADQFYTEACLILRYQYSSKTTDEMTLTIHPVIPTLTLKPFDDTNKGQFDGLILGDPTGDYNHFEAKNFKSLKYIKLPFQLPKKTTDMNKLGYSLIYFPTKDVLILTGYPLLHPHLWVMKQPFSEEAKWECILVSKIDTICFTLMDDEFSKQSILDIILSVLETYQEIDRMNMSKNRSLSSCESLFSTRPIQAPTKSYDDSLCCSSCCLL